MVLSTKFIKQTKQLELAMIQMGQDCLRGLKLCQTAIIENNKTLTQEISELHEESVVTGRECEQICMRILLLQHPVAKDLRRITVATNTVRDFTRIADQEKEVSDLICELDHPVEDDEHLYELFRVAHEMISYSIDAYMQRDESLANKVIKLDDAADSAYAKAKEAYVERLSAKKEDSSFVVNLLLISKYLERICDHAYNIAKWVLYQKSGVIED